MRVRTSIGMHEMNVSYNLQFLTIEKVFSVPDVVWNTGFFHMVMVGSRWSN